MLQGIRDRAQGWIAWVIVILICIPFALWGVNEYFGNDPNQPVATVNGTEIPLMEFQRSYQVQQSSAQQLLRTGLVTEADLRQQTLDALIDDEVLVQSSVDADMRVSDEQLAAAIRRESVFQEDGQFSQERYEQFLASQGMSPGRFEYTLRRDLLKRQVGSAFGDSEIVTKTELAAQNALSNQQRTFRTLTIPRGKVEVPEPEAAAIESEYNENKSSYMSEEQVQLGYVVLSREGLMSGIQADEAELRAIYEAQIGNYGVPEQRKASHILVRVGDDLNEQDGLVKVEAIRTKLDGGASFEELAKTESDDPGSGSKGGDLGFFGKGIMDPSFDESAFTLEEGEVSAPVRSGFGWHLIKVTDIRPAGTKPFEEVRDDVLAEYQREKADQLYFEQAERLANLAFENPDSLDAAAESLGLEIQTSELVGRLGAADGSVLGERRVMEAAFSEPVLRDGENSALVDLDDGRVVVVRLVEHAPSRQLELDEVKERIGNALRFSAQAEAVRTKATEVLAKLRAGTAATEVAQELELKWESPLTFKRNDSAGLGRQTLGSVFRMPKPVDGKSTFDAVEDSDGGVKVIELVEVTSETAKEDAQPDEAASRRFAMANGQASLSAYRDGIRKRADVTVFTERLTSSEDGGY
ncbi:MAG: SurA N-terminal domain-containing protein [Gammaproteobacteria bacterium]|nr:SurA N-terminal domain-containing protein [Gammaproteobacteria bacterium]